MLIVYGILTISIILLLIYSDVIDFKQAKRNEIETAQEFPRLTTTVHDIDKYLWHAMNLSEIMEVYKTGENNIGLEILNYNYNTSADSVHDFCSNKLVGLKGWLNMPDGWADVPPSLEKLERDSHETISGDNFTYSPPLCTARYTVAIIIPYRNRNAQLRWFLSHMNKIWQRQNIRYTLYVVEQSGEDLFNRAKLMNVGFLEAIKGI